MSSTTSSRFDSRRDEGLDAIEGALQILGRRGLDQVGKGSVGEAVLLLLLDRDDLHRNVARFGLELEVVQHGPAEHVGQKDIERDDRRSILAGKSQRFVAARRHESLEALVARQTQQHPRVVRIVLDDERGGIAGRDVVAVVRESVSSRATGRIGKASEAAPSVCLERLPTGAVAGAAGPV